jgi:hypothetical protein
MLAKECYSMKLDLLTNATVVNNAMRFVSQKSKENLKSSYNKEEEEEESKEPDYNEEDKEQLEEKEEEETGEIMTETLNQVF